MLALSVSMSFTPEDFPKVKEYTQYLAVISREEAGCVEYWWAESMDAPNTLRLFECWESNELLQGHLKQPHELVWMSEYQPLVRQQEVFWYDPATKRSM